MLDKWWGSLSEDIEEVRVRINDYIIDQTTEWLKLILISMALPFVALFSTFQPIYVADKIIALWMGFILVIGGIILGIQMTDRGIERIFRKKALT